MRAIRWSALFAIVSLSAITLVLLFTSRPNTNVEAVNYGLGPIPSAGLPWTGTQVGINLCDATFTWTQTGGGPDVDYNALTTGTKDFSQDCFNNSTNAPGASPDYIDLFLLDNPSSNFSSIEAFTTPAAWIAPGPGHRDPNDMTVVDWNPATNPDLGSLIGVVSSDPVTLTLKVGQGVSNCNQQTVVEFPMMNATVDFFGSERVYSDVDTDGTVSNNDVRLTDVGWTVNDFLAGSTVACPADSDCTDGLVAFAANEKHDETVGANGIYDPGEAIYDDVDADGTVSNNDVRLTDYGPAPAYPYDAGSTVACGTDPDCTNALVVFVANEKHVDTPGFTANVYDVAAAVERSKVSENKDPILALGEGNPNEPQAQDNDFDGLPDHVNKYTGYFLDLFDPDLLNPEEFDSDTGTTYPEVNGPKLPLQPLARYAGRSLVAGADQILEFLTFHPGQLMEMGALENSRTAQMFAHDGYVLVVVLNDPTTADAPATIQDFCTPLGTTTVLMSHPYVNRYGIDACTDGGTDTLDCLNNPPIGAMEDVRYINPAAGTGLPIHATPSDANQHFAAHYTQSQRDADDDGWENDIDTCPYDDDSLGGSNPWDPHAISPGDDDGDGLPATCDDDDTNPLTTAKPNWDEETTGSPFSCTSCVGSATNTTVTVSPNPGWTNDEWVNKIVEHAVGGARTIISNTNDTLTVASDWISNPVSGDITISGDTFFNRQDICPKIINQSQFQQELVNPLPEDGGQRADTIGDPCDNYPATADGHWHGDFKFYPYCVSDNLATDDADGDGWCDADEAILGSTSVGLAPDTRPAADSTPEHVYLDLRYNLARQAQSINHAHGARPIITVCEYGSAVCGTGMAFEPTDHVPTGTAANPYPHPDTGEPVGAIDLFCNDGVDNDGDLSADREDNLCRIGPNFSNLTPPMRTDLDTLMPDTDGDDDTSGIGYSWQEILRGSDPLKKCAADGTPNNELLDPWVFDLDDNGQVTGNDVFSIFPHWLRTESMNNFVYRPDLDGNGTISGNDVFTIFPKWLQKAPGCP